MASEENECQALWTLSLSAQEPLLQSLLRLAEAINCACQCLNGAAVPNLCHNQQRAVNVGQSAQSQSLSQSQSQSDSQSLATARTLLGVLWAGSETKRKSKRKPTIIYKS